MRQAEKAQAEKAQYSQRIVASLLLLPPPVLLSSLVPFLTPITKPPTRLALLVAATSRKPATPASGKAT